MKQSKRKELLFLIFPNLRLLKVSFDSVKCGYKVYKAYKNRKKMRFPVKLAIGSAIAFIFIFIVGFMVFPKMIKSKVKKMTALLPGNEIRGLFTKVPFALDFKIYMFNVTNPMEVQAGQKPKLRQVGPFCYQEWKSKVSILDNDEEDTMNYNPVDVFIAYKISDDCISGDTEVTILHPLIVGMVNTVNRQKPAMLNLVAKAIKSIYKDPQSVYLTAKAKDILFDSVVIDCSVKDFAGKAVCTQLKTEAKDLKHLSDTELGFSLLGPKNGTPGKTFKVYRGKKDSHDLGRILQYDGQAEMEIWPTKECNQIRGTDGTIFPPFLKAEEGLVSFAPDMCRSLAAVFDRKTKYDGIPVREYSATLGDMSKNADEKCYCLTPETCLKKGLMDLYKCVGLPLYISLPHFYESDVSYLNAVEGLSPQKDKHGIKILFEPTTGSPVYAKKRLQFSMPLEPIDKVPLFNNLPTLVHPIFWVEEGVELNITYTKQLKDFFKIMKIVKISKWVIILCSLAGLGAAGYLHFKKSGGADITPVHKVQPVNKGPDQQNGISRVGGFEGHVNHAMSENEIDKY